jgi:alkaline phosphatase D
MSDSPQALYGFNHYTEGPLVAGPLIGEVNPGAARIWVQARAAVPLTLRIYSLASSSHTEMTLLPEESEWLCLVFEVPSLHSGETYEYAFSSEHGETTRFPLRSGPPPQATRTRLAFGSCYKEYRDRPLPIFTAILSESPDLFVILGDTCYTDADDRQSESTHMQAHLRNRNHDGLRSLVARVPSLGIWDDHDYGPNDSDGRYSEHERSLRCFRRMWAQRQFGTETLPGVFSKIRFGPVELFLLDSRSYRRERQSVLGDAQLQWLKMGLIESTAPVKLILSGTQLLPEVAALPGWDWECFRRDGSAELADLLTFLAEKQVSGVLWLSGDPHLGQLLRLRGRTLSTSQIGPDLWELTSSPLANRPWPQPVWPADSHESHAFDRFLVEEVAAENYGIVDVDLSRSGAEIRLSLCAEDGSRFFTYDIPLYTLAQRPRRRRSQAAAIFDDQHAYCFRGSEYARYDLRSGSLDPGYPKPIADGWKGVPGDIDAVLIGKTGKPYFFSGNGYVRYDREADRADAGYPKYIKRHFSGVFAADLDAILAIGDDKAYFIKGPWCVRYDLEQDRAEPGYPQPLAAEFPGAPDGFFDAGVDAAIAWHDGGVFFIKSGVVLKYDLAQKRPASGFPRQMSASEDQSWFGFLG